MSRLVRLAIAGVCVSAVIVAAVVAQDREKGKAKKEGGEADAPKVQPLPDDERLLALHRDFVKKAEVLAKEYEGDKDWGKARAVYEEILKLVPQYPSANAKRQEMLGREATAKVVAINIKANEDWQDTGIDLVPGKPIHIVAGGSWTFLLEMETTADGITIPKELKDFNPGCLVGFISSAATDPKEAKPFIVGREKQMISEQSGRLYLRMYDTDPSDNSGFLKVEIRGTFGHKK
jgi:hypothetical protein